MTPGIIVPSVALEGILYRFTYEGQTPQCRYEYDLRTTPEGYDCQVCLRSATGRAVETITRPHARELFITTARAMRDITTPASEWEWYGDEAILGLRMSITASRSDPFGPVATRIINDLPRVTDLSITAYYAPDDPPDGRVQ